MTPEERAAAIADNYDSYLRSATVTPKVIIAAHIRDAEAPLRAEVDRLRAALEKLSDEIDDVRCTAKDHRGVQAFDRLDGLVRDALGGAS